MTGVEPPGFLILNRYKLAVVQGESRSKAFPYDIVDRRAIDASIMVAHAMKDGTVHVYLRTAIRPPVQLRADGTNPAVWELPAGLIEPGEAPRDAAVRELEEELGFVVKPEDMLPLGEWGYPAPGFVGEKHFFYHCEVDPSTIKPPIGDGSPLEENALIVLVPLKEAIAACVSGLIRDEKTELGLRRLADVLI